MGAVERVEIELEPVETKRSRRRSAPIVVEQHAAPAVERPIDVVFTPASADPPSSGDRSRPVVIAAAIGVVALCFGWVLGRAGGDGDAAQTGATTETTQRSATTTATTEPTGETLPRATLPRPSTTTTVPPVWQRTRVTIDPRLAGSTDRIVVVATEPALYDLDLATGLLSSIEITEGLQLNTGRSPIAGADWVLLSSDQLAPATRIYRVGESEPERMTVADPYNLMWQYGTDRFWLPTWSDESGPVVREIDLTGRDTGREFSVNGLWPSSVDPSGQVIVGDTIGMYVADDTGSRRMPPGRPVALGLGHIVSLTCGDTIGECGLRVYERATGAAADVPRPVVRVDLLSRYGHWLEFLRGASTVTSDGKAALLPVSTINGMVAMAVVDLVTGTEREFAVPLSNGYVVPSGGWSADGRFAFVNDDGVLTAFDRETGEQFAVVLDGAMPEVFTLAVRPPG
jgi:hypothetical protein